MRGARKRSRVLVSLLAVAAVGIIGMISVKLFQGGVQALETIRSLRAKASEAESKSSDLRELNLRLLERVENMESEMKKIQEGGNSESKEVETSTGPAVDDSERHNGIGADGKYHWYPDRAGDKLGWADFVKKAPEDQARDLQMLVKAEATYRENIATRGPWPKTRQECYDFYTRAFYPCRSEENIGHPGWSPEGGKWMCELHQLGNAKSSVVYSVGSSGDTGFEKAIHDICPDCEIHTFDHTLDPITQRRVESLGFVNFHPWGVTWPLNSDTDSRLKNLPDIMEELKHEHLAIFKIDCEGCEWGVFEHIFSDKDRSYAPFDQVEVELHDLFDWGVFGKRGSTKKEYGTGVDRLNDFIKRMEDHGYRLFHWELNFQDFNCAELAFIHERVVDPSGKHSRRTRLLL